jgi:hypothetical protein
MTELWIAGKLIKSGKNWEILGVFSTEQLAVDACSTDDHFVGPIKLDEKLSEDNIDWAGHYYPISAVSKN